MQSYRPLMMLLASLLLGACGQKGPLVRPEHKPATQMPAPATPSPESPVPAAPAG